MNRKETSDLLSRLEKTFGPLPIRTMPSVRKTAADQRAHEERITEQIADFKDESA